jgi:hypothetical protein
MSFNSYQVRWKGFFLGVGSALPVAAQACPADRAALDPPPRIDGRLEEAEAPAAQLDGFTETIPSPARHAATR